MRYLSPMAEGEELDNELDNEKQYWVFATLWECALGLGDVAAVAKWDEKARCLDVADWMHQTREKHGERLRMVQQEFAQLLSTSS